jgi:hypothetical protein
VPADSLCPGLAESSSPGSPHPVPPKAKSRGKTGKRTKKGKKQQADAETPGKKGTRTKKGKKPRPVRPRPLCLAPEPDEQQPADDDFDQDDLESVEPPQDRVIAVASWHHDRAQVCFAKA